MIPRIMLRTLHFFGFKSFGISQIPFGPFTLLVDASASGKSDVQDALRFLHGCAQGSTIAEMIAWTGGSAFALEVEAEPAPGKWSFYSILVYLGEETKALEVSHEVLLETNGQAVFDQNQGSEARARIYLAERSALARIVEDETIERKRREEARLFVDGLRSIRFLDLASDAAALLSSESGHIFFIEEIDNDLPPPRLHLLLDGIEQATRNLGCQVIATTRNPQLLAHLSPKAREDAVLLVRREHKDVSGAIRIVNLPDGRRILKSRDLGRLLATGWLEDAVKVMKVGPPPRVSSG